MIPTFALPGESAPGQFGPEQRDAARPDVVVDAEHVVRREALGDADHGLDAGVDRLVDRVGGEARRDEDHRRVRARLRDRVGHRVEDRDALDVLAALAGRDAGDDVRAVVAVARRRGRSPRCPVRPWTTRRVSLVDDDRHLGASCP